MTKTRAIRGLDRIVLDCEYLRIGTRRTALGHSWHVSYLCIELERKKLRGKLSRKPFEYQFTLRDISLYYLGGTNVYLMRPDENKTPLGLPAAQNPP
jgi:hypothetical protein